VLSAQRAELLKLTPPGFRGAQDLKHKGRGEAQVSDHDVDVAHLISTRVGHQSTTDVSLLGPEPDERFAFKKLLKFTSPQVLKAYRREEAVQVADLDLSPHFNAERSSVRKPAFIPSDVECVVFRSLREIGPPV